MSFWKQEPPKPTLALRKRGPMRESVPVQERIKPVLGHHASQTTLIFTLGLTSGPSSSSRPSAARKVPRMCSQQAWVQALEG